MINLSYLFVSSNMKLRQDDTFNRWFGCFSIPLKKLFIFFLLQTHLLVF